MSLINHYQVITVTHHDVNINDLSKFYISGGADELENGLSRITAEFNIKECIYLETCNRVSFIMYANDLIEQKDIRQFFKVVNPDFDFSKITNIESLVNVLNGTDAIDHVLRVVSSIDSVIIGERQILSQFRKAYHRCKSLGYVYDNLRLLEQAAVATAKKVYRDTRIAEKPLSVVSLAMRRLRSISLDPLSKVVLVGAGETNRLVGKFLEKSQFENITVYNRSVDHGVKLSDSLNGTYHPLSELKHINGNFDVIFICTSANKVLIDEKMYQQMLEGASSNKILIDLAVPSNIDPTITKQYDVTYIDIESLKKESERNLEFRQKEVLTALSIIYNQIDVFKRLYRERQIELSLSGLSTQMNYIKTNAMKSVFKQKLDALYPHSRALVIEMMNYMEKKCIAIPMKLAKTNIL